MRITGPGRVGIGNTNPSAGLHLSKISGTSDVNTMTIDGANTVNGQNHTGLFVNPSQTASNASAVYGIFAQPAVSANTGTTSNLVGVAGEPSASGVGGTVSIMYGGLFEPQITAGTVSNAIGVYAGGTAGSATTAFGLQAYGALSGTVTTAYGVYIGAPSGTITTKYSLVTESGSGNVGFGTTSPGAPVHVSGGAGVLLRLQGTSGTCDHTPTSGSETVSCSSDERLKANISDADSVLDEFMKLRVRQYTIKSTGERTVGVIAQEVKKVAPAMVHEEKGGYYKVEQIDPWKLLKAIQELKEENEALKARIDKLEKERR
jgi:hypothetical protein